MLVLSRRIGEVVMIGDEIAITLIDIRRGLVRLGIEAPKSVRVHRKEIYDLILAQARNAPDAAAPVSQIKQSIYDKSKPTG